jgi:hypothetical protein
MPGIGRRLAVAVLVVGLTFGIIGCAAQGGARDLRTAQGTEAQHPEEGTTGR